VYCVLQGGWVGQGDPSEGRGDAGFVAVAEKNCTEDVAEAGIPAEAALDMLGLGRLEGEGEELAQE
jgi:hypothetical protein